jgi:GNAT superfamily N-acetyltransferase
MKQNYEWREDEFTISTDRSRLQIDVIHNFLKEESYWATERTLEQIRKAIENSLPFGIYRNASQIGFARVVTDYATFAYIGDVFVLKNFRGRGLSKKLMQKVVSHPELKDLTRWILATKDAHTLYEKFGFTELLVPSLWMERGAPQAN